ncbi:MAG: hypothetical protein AB7V42_15935 [Thermoleophilia bacterium]
MSARNRRWGAATAGLVAAGAVAAAMTGTASAATSSYSCIIPTGDGPGARQVDNVTNAIDLDVAFAGDFPDVIVGKPFGVTPAVRYTLGNDYLKALGEAGVLADGENALNGITFWVSVAASNTVEGQQTLRATVNASATTRVIWNDATGEASVQRYVNTGTSAAPVYTPTGDPVPYLSGSATLNTTGISWTAKSSAPVTFSVAPAGTLGQLPVSGQWLRNNNTANAPTGANANEYLAAARPYGSVYIRSRFGDAGGNGGGSAAPDAGGRSSADCVAGQVTQTGAAFDAADPVEPGVRIGYSEAGNVAPGTAVPRAGDRGRYTVGAGASPVIGTAQPGEASSSFVCLDGLGRQGGLNRETNYGYTLKVATGDPGTYAPGKPYVLKGTSLSATIPPVMIKGLYANLLSYESLPSGGHLDEPLTLWLAISGAGTAQGTQVVKAEARWKAEFLDPDGVSGSGDETFPASSVTIALPDTTWTPSGTGPITFTVAPPGNIPTQTLVGFGHSGDAGAVFPYTPYGSLLIRAETGRYGETLDCLEGSIAITNPAIAWSNLGNGDPNVRIPTPVAAGAPPATTTVVSGSRGRYTITHQQGEPFAVVPSAASAKVKTAAPKPKFSTLVKGRKVYLKVTATLPKTLAGRSFVVQRKVGKKYLTVLSVKVPKTGKISRQVALNSAGKKGAKGVKGIKKISLRATITANATSTAGSSAVKAVTVKALPKR